MMRGQNKGFLNLNRFKSGKAIKQQAKIRQDKQKKPQNTKREVK
jgi:hypothetical protein